MIVNFALTSTYGAALILVRNVRNFSRSVFSSAEAPCMYTMGEQTGSAY